MQTRPAMASPVRRVFTDAKPVITPQILGFPWPPIWPLTEATLPGRWSTQPCSRKLTSLQILESYHGIGSEHHIPTLPSTGYCHRLPPLRMALHHIIQGDVSITVGRRGCQALARVGDRGCCTKFYDNLPLSQSLTLYLPL